MDEVMTVADAGGSRASNLNGSPSSQNLLPHNLPLLSAFLAFALAQFLKVFTNWSAHPPRLLRSAKIGFCFTTIQDCNFLIVRCLVSIELLESLQLFAFLERSL